MVSIKDIAREAGVAHSTVSRALRNSPLINPETRKLIHRIAGEKGYVASAVARSLVTRRTNTIGVVVTTIADPFAGEVIGGIEELALAHEYSVILAASHADPARELHAVQSFQQGRVDAVLVMASHVGVNYLPMLSGMHAPIVPINSHHPGEFVHSVRIDDLEGARTANGHLVGLGHRHIAYIGPPGRFSVGCGADTGVSPMSSGSGPVLPGATGRSRRERPGRRSSRHGEASEPQESTHRSLLLQRPAGPGRDTRRSGAGPERTPRHLDHRLR